MNKIKGVFLKISIVVLNIIAIGTSLVAYILPVERYEGQGLPYTVNINATFFIQCLLIISVFFSIIAFILGRKSKVVLLIFIILIIVNSYELGSVSTISNFADKGILPVNF